MKRFRIHYLLSPAEKVFYPATIEVPAKDESLARKKVKEVFDKRINMEEIEEVVITKVEVI